MYLGFTGVPIAGGLWQPGWLVESVERGCEMNVETAENEGKEETGK